MNPNIATLDEAVEVLAKEMPRGSFSVSCTVWQHTGEIGERQWNVSVIFSADVCGKTEKHCRQFRDANLTQCVHSALVWYREHRKAVTA